MIQIVQGHRGYGKTEFLIKWLMEGVPVDEYPGWSRAIVCVDANRARNTQVMLKKASQHLLDNFNVALHVKEDDKAQRELRAIHDMRKCVWSLQEFQRHRYGGFHHVEYAIDDLDDLLSYLLHAKCPPAVVTGSNFTLTTLGPGEEHHHYPSPEYWK
jgi:hypothetical protein